MKRLNLDIFLEDADYQELTTQLDSIKAKCKDHGEEKSSIIVHDCGNATGKPCINKEIIL
tara:strand:- start:178 stop:357 length:180 start_codon:yes stop_codon:yes gene_type:complete